MTKTNILPDYTYNNGTITVKGDLIWEGDFYKEALLEYFPQLTDKLYDIKHFHVIGNFVIKGELGNKTLPHQTYSGNFGIRVDGDLNAESVWLDKRGSILVQGNINASRYIYINIYIFGEYTHRDKIVFQNLINTPLFIMSSSDFKHRGYFSENCLIIKSSLAEIQLYHPYKVHQQEALDKALIDDENKIKVEDVISRFEAGKSIFENDYIVDNDPNSIQTYFEPVTRYLKQQKYKEAKKELASMQASRIRGSYYLQRTLIAYYETLILSGIDCNKNAAKIEKNCLKILKNIGSWDSKIQPREINTYAVDYLSALYEEKKEYQKALDLLKRYNSGDEAYYVRRTNLLLKLGEDVKALIPAHIAIEHFGSSKLNKFKSAPLYKEYTASLHNQFSTPKGYKRQNLNSFNLIKIYRGVGTHDPHAPVVYNNDVHWNSDLIGDKDLSCYFKVNNNQKITLVILGDLYVNGKLYVDSMDIYVEGNVFADTIHLKNAQFECTGHVLASKEIIIYNQPSIQVEDVDDMSGNSVTYIGGDVRTPLLAVNPEYFCLGGSIAPKTICIGMKEFQFSSSRGNNIYTEKDLNKNMDVDNIFDSNLYEHLINKTLFEG